MSLPAWPKGAFQFTAEKGFIGEAEKLMVTGNYRAAKQVAAKQVAKTDSLNQQQEIKSHRESRLAVQQNKAGASGLVWVATAALLLLVFFLVRHKL